MLRLFFAISLPPQIKDQLQIFSASGLPAVRWTGDAQLHLTLRFLGETPGHLAEDIDIAVQNIRSHAFSLRLSGLGQFGDRKKASTLWVGVEPVDQITSLHHKIDRAVQSCGLPPDSRRYRPHITIARCKHLSRQDADFFVNQPLSFADPEFQVNEFHLYSSRMGHGGSHYEIEASYPLLPTPDRTD